MDVELPKTAHERENLVQLMMLYRDVLGRDPDIDGLLYWNRAMLDGTTAKQVSDSLRDSPEGRAHASAQAGTGRDRTEGRSPEPAGMPPAVGGLDVLSAVFPFGIPVEHRSGYAWWLDEMQKQRSEQLKRVEPSGPGRRVAFVLPLDGSKGLAAARRMIAAVKDQSDPRWTLVLVSSAITELKHLGYLGERIREPRIRAWRWWRSPVRLPARLFSGSDLVCWLGGYDSISPLAAAELLAAGEDADVLSSDGDRVDRDGAHLEPAFGTEWDPDGALAQPPPGLVAIRATLLAKTELLLRGDDPDVAWEIFTQATAVTVPARIRHVPAVLGYRPPAEESRDRWPSGGTELVQKQLVRMGKPDCRVVPGEADGTVRVIHPMPAPAPLVSLVVPTRDRADLLRTCLDGVLARTAYPRIEVVVVDNGSEDEDTHQLFAALKRDARVQVIRDERPFDWSALNHLGITASRGEVIVLLNNDIEISGPGWLDEMVSQAVRPDVGIVGAKLLYPSGSVQHAGIVLDDVSAWHPWRHAPGDGPGYRSQLATVRTASAVTGACVALRRSVYDEVGGLEGGRAAVTWGDVDLCLRIRRAGYRVVWTPHAVLHHVELATRGSDEGVVQRERFDRERAYVIATWGRLATHDPFFSPHLSPCEPTARIRLRSPA